MRGKRVFWLAGSVLATVIIQGSNAYANPIDLVVKLKERVSMQTLAKNAVELGIVYTPEQIRELAAPSNADYAKLLAQLKARGFTVIRESKTHLFVTVRAEKPTIENAFATKLDERLGTRRPLAPAIVPAELELVDSVVGLSNERKLKPRYRILAEQPRSGGTDQPGESCRRTSRPLTASTRSTRPGSPEKGSTSRSPLTTICM